MWQIWEWNIISWNRIWYAARGAAILGEKYRITVLTPALIRLEYNENGKFEDRATQSVLNRDFPVPQFQVVSPITEPQNPVARAAKAATWLPKGLWADFFDGTVYHGGRIVNLWRGVENIPVLMKAGAIVPMKDMSIFDNSVDNPEHMEVKIFPAEDASFTLWEDAGDTSEDTDEDWASTQLAFQGGTKMKFTIRKAMGNLSVLPKNRTWKLIFTAVEKTAAEAAADGKPLDTKVSYCRNTSCLTVEIPATSVEKEICITFPQGLSIAGPDIEERCYKVLEKAQIGYDVKANVLDNVKRLGRDAVASLVCMDLNPALFGELCEILTA